MTSRGILSFIRSMEELLLALLLCSMIVLSCLQIAMRLFFNGGFLWADPLLRYLVLWVGMLGAVLGVAQNKHIALDIFESLMSERIRPWVACIAHLFSATVCGTLAYASYRFIAEEIAFGGSAILTIPSWCWNLVFPVAFSLMSLRYGIETVLDALVIAGLAQPKKRREDEPR